MTGKTRSRFVPAIPVLVVLLICGAVSFSFASDHMLGIVPSDGTMMLTKRFAAMPGTTILGVQFENNDENTVFPEVSLIRGPLTTLSEGTLISSVLRVHEISGVVVVYWPASTEVTEEIPYYVAIRFPNGPSKSGPGVGPGIGADNIMRPNGSFLATGPDEELIPIRADLTVSLLTTGTMAGNAGGPYKSSENEPGAGSFQTYLRVSSPSSARAITTIEFSVAQPTRIGLAIYDVAGRCVRTLAQAQGAVPHGSFRRTWDCRDSQGEVVAAGLYLVRLKLDQKSMTQKLILTR